MFIPSFKFLLLVVPIVATYSSSIQNTTNDNSNITTNERSNNLVTPSSNDSNEVTLTFDPNGGSLLGYKNIKTTTSTFFKDIKHVPGAYREGAGETHNWYFMDNGIKMNAVASTTFTQDTTLKADWNLYTITFSSGEGVFTNGENEYKIEGTTCVHSDDISNPICGNKTFVGWYDSEDESQTLIKFPYYPSKNASLVAKYDVGEYFTIAFNAKDGYFSNTNDGKTKMLYQSMKANATWGQLKDYVTIPEPIYDGDKRFCAWQYNGTTLTDDFVFSGPLMLTASYEPAITITFDSNGGRFPDGSSEKVSNKFSANTKFKEYIESAIGTEAPTYTQGGTSYPLLGWFLKADASDEQINIDKEITDTTSFKVYACYKIPHTITFEGDTDKYSLETEVKSFYRKDNLEYLIKNKSGYQIALNSIEVYWNDTLRTRGTDYTFDPTGVGNEYKLVINDAPSADIRVSIKSEAGYYGITHDSKIAHCTSFKVNGGEGNPTIVTYKSNVNVEVTAENGYEVKSIEVLIGAGQVYYTAYGNKCDFEMPAENVIIKVTITGKTYPITLSSKDAGVQDVNFPTTAEIGQSVTITASPNVGRSISKIRIVYGSGEKSTSSSKLTFKMPASAVSVYVTSDTKKYNIDWINYDGKGSIRTSSNVKYGTMPNYENDFGGKPSKESTAEYEYTFTKWTPDIKEVTESTSYTAQFMSTKRSYTIKFINYDGTLISSNLLEYGTKIDDYDPYTHGMGEILTKPSTKEYSYTFSGWNKVGIGESLGTVKSNVVYKAQYSNTKRSYDVTFVDEDGNELQKSKVNYGEMASYEGVTPTKKPDSKYSYEFAGWSPAVGVVTGPTQYKAVFNQTTRKYNIRFLNYDDTVLQDTDVTFGEVPTYFGDTPTKPDSSDGKYTYTFKGWDTELTKVAGDKVYKAVFEEHTNSVSYTFNANSGYVKNKSTGKEDYTVAIPVGENIKSYLNAKYIGVSNYSGFKGFSFDNETVILDSEVAKKGDDRVIYVLFDKYKFRAIHENCTVDREYINSEGLYGDDFGVKPNTGYVIEKYEYSFDGGTTYANFPEVYRGKFYPYSVNKFLTDGQEILVRIVTKNVSSNIITVSFDAGEGGYFGSGATVVSIDIENGTKTLNEVIRENNVEVKHSSKTFDHWVDGNGNTINLDAKINSSQKIYVVRAIWKN